MLTLLYFFLSEPDSSSPPGQELGEVLVLPSKASIRIRGSFTQAPSANSSPGPGTPQGDTDLTSVSSHLAWRWKLIMKSAVSSSDKGVRSDRLNSS